MQRTILSLCALALLTACGDPLAGVPRLAEVDLAENDPAAQALPTEDEIAREGFFGTDAAVAEALSPVPPDVPQTAAPRRGGLLGLFRRVPETARHSAETAVEAAPESSKDVVASETEATANAENIEIAALTDGDVQEPRRRGLFGRLRQPTTSDAASSDLPEVTYGTVLPYGVIARNCSAKRQPLGRKVEGASGGYKLYDSNPRTTALRTFYITGFDDGCPRQLTAAHVLLGAPSFYELLHYGPASQHLKTGKTDAAYEKVKGQVCGVRKGRPCGARMNRLERSTFFVNAYPRSDDNTAWSEMLIHDGAVVATAKKSSG